MKKRLLIAVVTLFCVIGCAFWLAACDDDGVTVESVTLNKTEITLEVGGEETLTATVTPEEAAEKSVTWKVSPAGIVTVENGKVTAVAEGTATVTATVGGKSATCSVTVNAAESSAAFVPGTYVYSESAGVRFGNELSETQNVSDDELTMMQKQVKEMSLSYVFEDSGKVTMVVDGDDNTYIAFWSESDGIISVSPGEGEENLIFVWQGNVLWSDMYAGDSEEPVWFGFVLSED